MFQLSGDVMRPDNNTPPSRDAFWEYLELYRTFKYFSTATGTRVFHARFFNLRTIGNTRNRRGRGISSLPWLSILDSNSFLCFFVRKLIEHGNSFSTYFEPRVSAVPLCSSLCVHVAFVRFTLLRFWVMEDWIAGEVNKNKQRIFGGIREDMGNDERNIRSTNGKMKLWSIFH